MFFKYILFFNLFFTLSFAHSNLKKIFFEHYQLVFQNLACPLVIENDGKMSLNANASYVNNTCKIQTSVDFFTSNLTLRAKAFILCHEIGHFLAGAPFGLKQDGSMASVEGEADYYSSLSCLKEILPKLNLPSFEGQNFDEIGIDQNSLIIIKKECNNSFPLNTQKKEICLHSILSFIETFNYFYSHSGSNLPDYNGFIKNIKSQNTIKETLREGYPDLDCRFYTVMAGALCNPSENLAVNKFNPIQGTCYNLPNKENSFSILTERPKCWFNKNNIDTDEFLFNGAYLTNKYFTNFSKNLFKTQVSNIYQKTLKIKVFISTKNGRKRYRLSGDQIKQFPSINGMTQIQIDLSKYYLIKNTRLELSIVIPEFIYSPMPIERRYLEESFSEYF